KIENPLACSRFKLHFLGEALSFRQLPAKLYWEINLMILLNCYPRIGDNSQITEIIELPVGLLMLLKSDLGRRLQEAVL
ncbi:MAG: hypothetical protein ACXWRE_16150, partial [Pseudobdellovibrionaceae bacterium]